MNLKKAFPDSFLEIVFAMGFSGIGAPAIAQPATAAEEARLQQRILAIEMWTRIIAMRARRRLNAGWIQSRDCAFTGDFTRRMIA